MNKYYLEENGQPTGPFTIDQIRAKGAVASSLAWAEGWPNWKPLSEIPELSGTIPPAIPKVGPVLPPPIGISPIPEQEKRVVLPPSEAIIVKKTKKSSLKWVLIGLVGLIIVFFAILAAKTDTSDQSTTNAAANTSTTGAAYQEPLYTAEELEAERKRAALQEKINQTTQNITTLVVPRVTYDQGFFSGVNSVQVSVTNDTDFNLDRVVVSIFYKDIDGDFDREVLVFASVMKHQTMYLPASDRKGYDNVEVYLDTIEDENLGTLDFTRTDWSK